MGRYIGILVLIAIASLAAVGYGSHEEKQVEVFELEEALGFSNDGILERQGRVERHIRDCMNEHGFAYEQVDPLEQQLALTGWKRISEKEFIERFGYGVSTRFGRLPDRVDPNAQIRRQLSPRDRRAYDRALWGDSHGATFAEAVDSGEFGDLGGCTEEATEKVFGGRRLLSALVSKLDELDESILEAERMERATKNWAACMRSRGLRYTDPEQAEASIEKRFARIMGAGVRPGATALPDPKAGHDASALADLQWDELTVANADLECEDQEITPVERIVRAEYEREFREQNRSCSCTPRRADDDTCKFVVHEARVAATLACKLR